LPSRLAALALFPPLVLVSACDDDRPAVVVECERLAGGELARARNVSVRRGTRVDAERVFDGEVAGCDDEAAAAALALALSARATLPRELQPGRFNVHLDPELPPDQAPLRVVEAHVGSRSLFVDSHALDSLDRTIVLHELAHLATAGARPSRRRGKRLFQAIDEAVADFIAASASGSPRVGASDGEARDLSSPPVVEETEWALLGARREGSFEPHRMGTGLAAALYASEPLPGPLVVDVRRALSDRTPYPRTDSLPTLLSALVARCPERSRDVLTDALAAWLPDTLFPESLYEREQDR
jgi:hypothetical protein